MHAIILDGNLKSALAAVRSLGRAGVPVIAGAERGSAMALHSKYVAHRFVYPSPYAERDAFVRAVKAEAVRVGGKPVVFAFSDATFLSFYEARADLENYVTFLFPSEKAVGIAFDKAATYSLARISQVPTIATQLLETQEEVELAAEALHYPAVVKTRHSVTWLEGKGVFGSATFVHSKEELADTFASLKARHGEAPLIQDLITGDEYGVEMLAYEGHVIAEVVHRRLRSLSPTGGASVLKETVVAGALRDTLVSYSEHLVEELAWSGPIMVEWKNDSDSREPKLMEINGRFWGSLPLSIAAGADMPYLYYLLALGSELPQDFIDGRERVATRHFLGDVLHLLRVFFARDRMRKTHYPKRKQALKDFFRLPKGTKSDVWAWRDMQPALWEFVDVMSKRLKK